MAWIGLYRDDVRSVMAHGAIACIGSAALGYALSLAPLEIAAVLSFAGACAGAVVPLASRRCSNAAHARADLSGERLDAGVASSVRSFLSVVWLPLLGLLVCAFISSSCEFLIEGEALRTEFIGSTVAAALALAVCVVLRDAPFAVVVERGATPVLVALAIVLGAFPPGSFTFYVGAALVFAPLMFLSLYALSALTAVSATGEFPAVLVSGTTLFLASLVTAVGVLVSLFVPVESIGPFTWVLICAYFAVVIVQLGWGFGRRGDADAHDLEIDAATADAEPARSTSAAWSDRFEELAEAGGLTKREREIFEFVGKGHGSTYVSKALYISDNTVRTHIRNIYRKLGVHSREELLLLFDGSHVRHDS